MKSDCEFLDGIYAKAAHLEEDIGKQTFFQKVRLWKHRYRQQAALVAGGFLCALLLVVGINKRIGHISEGNIENGNISRYTRGNQGGNLEKSNMSVDDLSKDISSEGLSGDLKIFGRITDMYVESGKFYADILVEQDDNSGFNYGTITFLYKKQDLSDDFLFTVGEEVIVVLTKQSDSRYILTNIGDNLYLLSKDNMEEKIYESYSGKMLKREDINK